MNTNKPPTSPTFADKMVDRLTDEQYEKVVKTLDSKKDIIKTFKTQEQLDKLTANIIGDFFRYEKDDFINNMDDTAKLEFLFKKMSPQDQRAFMLRLAEESSVPTLQNPNQVVSAAGGKRNKSKKPKRRNSRSKRRKTVSKRRR